MNFRGAVEFTEDEYETLIAVGKYRYLVNHWSEADKIGAGRRFEGLITADPTTGVHSLTAGQVGNLRGLYGRIFEEAISQGAPTEVFDDIRAAIVLLGDAERTLYAMKTLLRHLSKDEESYRDRLIEKLDALLIDDEWSAVIG